MKKLLFIICLLLTLSMEVTCHSGKNLSKRIHLEKQNNCDSIVKLERLWETNKNTNYYINSLVGYIESNSGIEASCSKGTYGYYYSESPDSIFISDVLKWKKHFNCQ